MLVNTVFGTWNIGKIWSRFSPNYVCAQLCVHTVYARFAGAVDFKYPTKFSELLAIEQYFSPLQPQ